MPYRLHDVDIRDPLFEWFETRGDKVRIIEEKAIGRSRADALMVREDQLVGMEIKSDADTYERLARQVRDYDRTFDANMVVVGSSHAQVGRHVPEWWGIVVVGRNGHGGLAIEVARPWQRSPKTDYARKLAVLWRPELEHLLEVNHLPRYARKSKGFVIEALVDRVDHGLLDRQVCDELFERDYTTIDVQMDEWRAAHGR